MRSATGRALEGAARPYFTVPKGSSRAPHPRQSRHGARRLGPPVHEIRSIESFDPADTSVARRHQVGRSAIVSSPFWVVITTSPVGFDADDTVQIADKDDSRQPCRHKVGESRIRAERVESWTD